MALTPEEQRALEYNQTAKRRALAIRAREMRLRGDLRAAADLLANTEPLTRNGLRTGRQRDLIRYDSRFDDTLQENEQ